MYEIDAWGLVGFGRELEVVGLGGDDATGIDRDDKVLRRFPKLMSSLGGVPTGEPE